MSYSLYYEKAGLTSSSQSVRMQQIAALKDVVILFENDSSIMAYCVFGLSGMTLTPDSINYKSEMFPKWRKPA